MVFIGFCVYRIAFSWYVVFFTTNVVKNTTWRMVRLWAKNKLNHV